MGFLAPNERSQRMISGLVRGTGAAMTMSALRQVTTGLGLVEQTPPDAILKQRAFALLVRSPRLAFFLARRQVAVVELFHWAYGAGGGAAFALLPRSVLDRRWAGVAYGLGTWAVFELSMAPVLGLEQATKIRPVERLMFAADHALYGLILAGDRRWLLTERRFPIGWSRRGRHARF
jgi:hypothetical protein